MDSVTEKLKKFEWMKEADSDDELDDLLKVDLEDSEDEAADEILTEENENDALLR